MSHQLLQHLVPVQTDVRDLRIAAGMTQLLAAERFDLSLRVWQMKESAAKPSPLSQGEYEFLLLLAGKHPFLDLTAKAR
ncbi:transcriptional regulator [Pantoea dispersa]|uniref:transcriptional regulator n=1 Tax=Pantoea dispersa TaxID=59814 RepID=UPI002DBBF0A5|nr:transcriptional regulator [Pantoea dispersa]MEB5971154.1 transcriptional regulator [Pantoea dispersa]